jgi:ubiquinone/menaquinone biosynthesis C-methylase UbiE
VRRALLAIYWRLRQLIAPRLRYSQYAYEELLVRAVTPGVHWIDVGCGHSILPSWRSAEEQRLVANAGRLVGVDYDFGALNVHPSIRWRVRGDVTRLPFKDGSFDLVTANMVVEHLDNPADQFREVRRILRPNGVFLFHTPNALGYGVVAGRLLPDGLKSRLAYLLQGRSADDVFPTYYRANSEESIRQLARTCGFTVKEFDLVVSDAIFAMIPPVAMFELFWLRILMTAPFRRFRTNIVTVMQASNA